MKLPLAALPLLLIPYDSLTHLLGLDPGEVSQSFPATALLAVFYLLIRGRRLQRTRIGMTVLRYLLLSAFCMLLVTLGHVVVESAGNSTADDALRMTTASRQIASLILGLGSYLMFQDAVLRLGLGPAFRWILIGILPSLVLCAFQTAGGAFRAQGFSAEPSLLGDMLVFALFPAALFSAIALRGRLAVLSLGVAALFASFSGTGLMKAGLALFSHFVARGNIFRGLVLLILVGFAVYLALSFVEDNYLFQLYGLFQSFMESGNLIGGSFIDRFYGFFGPFSKLGELHAWLGYGFGGDTVYFDGFFDPDTAAAIRLEKTSYASISSLQAKILVYGGVVGYACYLAAWLAAWRSVPRNHPARFMIPTIFLASVFSLGPFFLPYVWLWLALGATAAPGIRRRSVIPLRSTS